jgi:hypothetical protein
LLAARTTFFATPGTIKRPQSQRPQEKEQPELTGTYSVAIKNYVLGCPSYRTQLWCSCIVYVVVTEDSDDDEAE